MFLATLAALSKACWRTFATILDLTMTLTVKVPQKQNAMGQNRLHRKIVREYMSKYS